MTELIDTAREKLPVRYRDVSPENPLAGKIINNGKSFYISGAVGVGKTHLLHSIQLSLAVITTDKSFFEMSNDIKMPKVYNIPTVLNSIKENFNEHKRDYIYEMVNEKYLLIDDFGVEKPTDWVTEQLYIVINSRYESCKPTIITTNLTIKEIAERYGDRIASRISELCEKIELKGEDRRVSYNK